MDKIKFKIKKKVFTCLVAKTAEERKEGYSGETDAPKENECMLFVFPEPGSHQMWIAGTDTALDIVFLNDDLKILEILTGKPDSEDLLGSSEDVSYVIEFGAGVCETIGLKVGNSISTIPEDSLKPDTTEQYGGFVLDADGNTQMRIKGGERIFSRKSTRKIVSQAFACKTDKDFSKLARTTLQEILAQNERKSEFVKGKTKETYELQV